MRKFSRSIQRRRAVVFSDSTGLTSADAVHRALEEKDSDPFEIEKANNLRAEALRQQIARLEEQLKTLEPSASSSYSPINLPVDLY